jgi:predicted nucleic acid-binding protein
MPTTNEHEELIYKIVEIMEKYKLKVYDTEYVEELVEKTIERNQKECSH